MTPLRQRMLQDMQLRNFSAGTQRSYIHYIAGFATHYRLSPDRLGLDDVRNYQLHLIEQKRLSPQSINCFVAAAKFLYTVTLDMPQGLLILLMICTQQRSAIAFIPSMAQRLKSSAI